MTAAFPAAPVVRESDVAVHIYTEIYTEQPGYARYASYGVAWSRRSVAPR